MPVDHITLDPSSGDGVPWRLPVERGSALHLGVPLASSECPGCTVIPRGPGRRRLGKLYTPFQTSLEG
jgi:hypothetical protein